MNQFTITTEDAAQTRARDYARNDPFGGLRRELAASMVAWEEATRAGRWEEAAAISERSEAIANRLHAS